jgi:hypothetical protein
MIENLVDQINAALVLHPHLLQLMHTLFWVKYWILMGLIGVFLYLVYSEDVQEERRKRTVTRQEAKHIFIA